MEFKDFEKNPQDLLGKMVLYEKGMSYSENRNRSISKIVKVTKTGFRIFTMPDTIFSLTDGYQKGLTGRQDMGVISKCTLLTEEEAVELKLTWQRNKELKALKAEMQTKLETMNYEQLQKMKLL